MTRILYRDAALAEGRSDRLRFGVSILVDDGRIAWIRPSDAEEDPGPPDGLEVLDAVGATIVPGMVDAHSHFTGAGGAHWMLHWGDSPASILRTAAHNATLLTHAGVRWARDVGAPTAVVRSTAGVAAGLEPPEALAAATWRGGELLGEPEAGTIREGGPADFFLVHGDPLSDPTALWRVWRVAWA